MPSELQIQKTVNAIRKGGVIAYATEAVYGLGCDPDNAQAIQKIVDLKARDAKQGFILIASQVSQLEKYLGELSSQERELLEKNWPEPTTLIVTANESVSELITGGRNTVAVRITTHPDTKKLCEALKHPLISTSANRSGQPAITHAWQIQEQFSDSINYLYPSTIGDASKPSTIIDASTGKILR